MSEIPATITSARDDGRNLRRSFHSHLERSAAWQLAIKTGAWIIAVPVSICERQ